MPAFISVHANNLDSLLCGIKERIYTVVRNGKRCSPPLPARRGIFSRLEHFSSRLANHVGLCNPWSYSEFLDTYQGSKRMVYERAVESLLQKDLTIEDAEISSFCKFEKILKFGAPRIISPRGARYNACVGRYLKAIEGRVYKGIARIYGGCTVMKGLNAIEVASEMFTMWSSFNCPAAVGLDASRFDQHVSVDALRWEHGVYNTLFYRHPELKEWLTWQLVNKCVARLPEAVVKFTVKGCRMSGDMNTSMGNCLLMCAMVYTYAKDLGIKVRLANNGDDCVVFMEDHDVKRFNAGLHAWFLEMGFTMKMEDPVFKFEHVEFCQSRPVCVDGEWIMCRNPVTALVKDSVCLHPERGEHMVSGLRAWATSVGESGQSWSAGVPVMYSAYSAIRRVGRGQTGYQLSSQEQYSGLVVAGARMQGRSVAIVASTRASFYYAWGITPDMQVALETLLDGRTDSLDSLCIDADNPLPSILDFLPTFERQ